MIMHVNEKWELVYVANFDIFLLDVLDKLVLKMVMSLCLPKRRLTNEFLNRKIFSLSLFLHKKPKKKAFKKINEKTFNLYNKRDTFLHSGVYFHKIIQIPGNLNLPWHSSNGKPRNWYFISKVAPYSLKNKKKT